MQASREMQHRFKAYEDKNSMFITDNAELKNITLICSQMVLTVLCLLSPGIELAYLKECLGL